MNGMLKFNYGAAAVFKPFRKFFPEADMVRVSCQCVGYKNWELDVDLLDAEGEEIDINGNAEADALAGLWGET